MKATLWALLAAFAALGAAGMVTACGGDDEGPGEPGQGTVAGEAAGSITIYSGRDEELIAPLIERFEEETGITADVRYGDTAELAGTIIEEGDNSPADVFFGQDAGALGALQKDKRLDELPADLLDRVEERFRSSEGRWIGTSGRIRVIAYDSRELSEDDLPESILGFTEDDWGGRRIGWAPTNGSFQAFVTALRLTEGEDGAREWLEGIVANDAQVYDGNTPIRDAIADGEIDVGFINHYYVARAIDEEGEDYPVRTYFPPGGDVGSLINVAGGGVLSTSGNKEAAIRFLEFLLEEESQRWFVEETKEYAMVSGLPTPDGQPDLDEVQQPDLDLSDLDDLQGTVTLIEESGAL